MDGSVRHSQPQKFDCLTLASIALIGKLSVKGAVRGKYACIYASEDDMRIDKDMLLSYKQGRGGLEAHAGTFATPGLFV